MTNKETLKQELAKLGYEMGCYNKDLEQLTKANLKKVIAELNEESTDIELINKKVMYIVTIDTVDNEKDITIKSVSAYENQFGDRENR